jgi:enoyl-CoA hydratase/carnithine racemase
MCGASSLSVPPSRPANAASLAFGILALPSPCHGQTMTGLGADDFAVAQAVPARPAAAADRSFAFETLKVSKEGAVLFANIAAPPMNLLGPELVRDLVSLIQQAEADDGVRVLVFSSADPDYFISHVDVAKIKEYGAEAARLAGEPPLGLLFSPSERESPLVTIAQIEGRVRGAGSEFVLACDMRFAARESAIFGQPEPGLGTIPGGRRPTLDALRANCETRLVFLSSSGK